MRRDFLITFSVILFAATAAFAKKGPGPSPGESKQKPLSLVRVNVTGQPYDYFRPWQKKAPISKRALGAVLSQGRVLVTADLVANQNYVELERAESGNRTAANVQVIDYEANLALLEPTDKKFLDGLPTLELGQHTVAIGTSWCPRRHRRPGHNLVDDALPPRCRAIPCLSSQHFDAIPREQLH